MPILFVFSGCVTASSVLSKDNVLRTRSELSLPGPLLLQLPNAVGENQWVNYFSDPVS